MPGTREEFLSHPWPGRLAIALAGPAANLLTAYLVLATMGVVGLSSPDHPNMLGAVPDTSVAWRAGARDGDRVVAVGGAPVRSWIEIFVANSRHPAPEPIDLMLERSGRNVAIHLSPGEREPFFSSVRHPPDPPVVGGVLAGMPAYKAGLKVGDRILAVNGKPVSAWDELPPALSVEVDKPVRLTIERAGRRFDVTVTPMNSTGGKGANGRIGIEAPRQRVYVERLRVFESLRFAVSATIQRVASVYSGMWLALRHPIYYREYMGGPMFIVQAASEQARHGWDYFLNFIATINIAIMAFNLLPIPVLDGGHILLAVVQGIRRRALSARTYLRFQKVGLIVLGTIFILILANDPVRVWQRQRAIDKAPRENVVAPPGAR